MPHRSCRTSVRPPNRTGARLTLTLAVPIVLLLAACGASGSGPTPDGGSGADPVAASLQQLGVDTDAGPRRAPDGSALGEDAAPLGSRAAFGDAEAFTSESAAHPAMELVVSRYDTSAQDTLRVEQIVGAQVSAGGTIDPGAVELLRDLSTAAEPWATPILSTTFQHDQVRTLRAVAAADLDGDGFDEIAALYVDPDDQVLRLQTFEDDAGGYADTLDALAAGAAIESVALIALDGDGDGTDELMAALSYADRIELTPIVGAPGSRSLQTSATRTFTPVLASPTLYARLSAGNLDYDNAEELAIVVNELTGSSSSLSGYATLVVLDDAGAGRAELDRRQVQAALSGSVAAHAADVSLADIDGDGLDEVVLAGATGLAWSCDDPFEALMMALDDAPAGLPLLHAAEGDLAYNPCDAANSWKRLFVFLATPDLDGDGVHEIAANELVYDDFADDPTFRLLTDVGIPSTSFLTTSDDANEYLSLATTTLVAADVTGDGRENLLLHRQTRGTIEVWGLSAISTIGAAGNGWALLSEVPMAAGGTNSADLARPIVLPANVDADGPVLRYGAGSHELVFTEPIVIAAMAAPPCHDDIDQNVGACVTRFGQGSSTSTDASLSVTVSASGFVGVETAVNVPFVGEVGAEFTKTVTATASAWAGTAYTVEKTVTYTTGPLEDGVVFTSVPYDVYRYEILSHPDPALVGSDVVIRLPREPVTMLAERGFYNGALPDGSLAIDEGVFAHVPGDVGSYPSRGMKDTILNRYDGLQFGPSGVGQGGGQTDREISVSTEVSQGGSLGLSYERTMKATSGVVFAGYSVGYGVDAALSFTSGTSTTFGGTVGHISASDYATNAYQWGIFSYDQTLGDQEFAVINYWVE